MRTSIPLIASVALWTASIPGAASAQFGNPAGMSPDTREVRPGVPAPGQPNVPERLFIQLAGRGNAGEMAAGQLAEARAQHTSVKAFARQMIADHAEAARQLAEAARPLGVPVPTEPDADQKATQARLEGLRGTAFDAAYLQAQLIDHQKTVTLLEWVIGNGQDAGLQSFAKGTLVAVQGHLRHVQALQAELHGIAAGPDAVRPGGAPERSTQR